MFSLKLRFDRFHWRFGKFSQVYFFQKTTTGWCWGHFSADIAFHCNSLEIVGWNRSKFFEWCGTPWAAARAFSKISKTHLWKMETSVIGTWDFRWRTTFADFSTVRFEEKKGFFRFGRRFFLSALFLAFLFFIAARLEGETIIRTDSNLVNPMTTIHYFQMCLTQLCAQTAKTNKIDILLSITYIRTYSCSSHCTQTSNSSWWKCLFSRRDAFAG